MTWATFILQTLNGLSIAAIYILLASGLTIVFGLQGIVNCAHGLFYMLGAYISLTVVAKLGQSFWLALPAAFLVNCLLGVLLEMLGIRTLMKWRREFTHVLILTVGFGILGQEMVKVIWGAVPQLAGVPPSLRGTLELGGLAYPKYWLFVILFTIVIMLGLFFFFFRTGLGTLVQSIALNSEVSQALGTNAPRINTIAFGLGTGLAGVAGVLAGPILSLNPNMAFELIIVIFVIIIFGGLGSLLGVVVSGVIVGLVMAFGTALLSGMIAKILTFCVMIAVLTFRPLGLFGRGTGWE
ncbi:MAG: branched-chain amino acid ABC transporter permease [Thermodesulfobacteriota bacterium]